MEHEVMGLVGLWTISHNQLAVYTIISLLCFAAHYACDRIMKRHPGLMMNNPRPVGPIRVRILGWCAYVPFAWLRAWLMRVFGPSGARDRYRFKMKASAVDSLTMLPLMWWKVGALASFCALYPKTSWALWSLVYLVKIAMTGGGLVHYIAQADDALALEG